MHNLSISPGLSRAEGIYAHIAADYLGCSDRTVRRFIQLGKLCAERYGRRAWLVFRSDVESLCNRRGESSNCPTSCGFSHLHSFIFSAVARYSNPGITLVRYQSVSGM
jgi:excisionase family DNA binding protein